MIQAQEFLRRTRVASVGLLAGLGAMTVAPSANAAPKCDIPAKVRAIERHMTGKYTPFKTTVATPKDRDSVIKVFGKDKQGEPADDKQFMIDPLTIKCAGKVRFVGVTDEYKDSLGKRYKVPGSLLYLNVVRSEDTVLQVFPGKGFEDPDQFDAPLSSLLSRTVNLRLKILHDQDSGDSYPAFVTQPAPHHKFGIMDGTI